MLTLNVCIGYGVRKGLKYAESGTKSSMQAPVTTAVIRGDLNITTMYGAMTL